MMWNKATLAALVLGVTAVTWGQAVPTRDRQFGLERGEIPALEIPISFDLMHANAGPTVCGCFWMIGGGSGLVVNLQHNISLVADLTAVHKGGINGTDEALTVFNYEFGPRYSYRTDSRWTPYGQMLIGSSLVSSNYAYYGSGTSYFSSTVGGGVQYRLSRPVALTVAEGDWVFSQAINSLNQRQNNIRITTGIVVRIPSLWRR